MHTYIDILFTAFYNLQIDPLSASQNHNSYHHNHHLHSTLHTSVHMHIALRAYFATKPNIRNLAFLYICGDVHGMLCYRTLY